MKNILVLISLFYLGSSYVNSNISTTNIDNRLLYMIGDWKSYGFVTDTYNVQQKIEANQHIELKGNELIFATNGFNSQNKFRYQATKSIFYNDDKAALWVKGNVNENYILNYKAYINSENTLNYTFYHSDGTLMRYIIQKESDSSFTETEQKWTDEGWEKTAWLRTQRISKNDRPLH